MVAVAVAARSHSVVAVAAGLCVAQCFGLVGRDWRDSRREIRKREMGESRREADCCGLDLCGESGEIFEREGSSGGSHAREIFSSCRALHPNRWGPRAFHPKFYISARFPSKIARLGAVNEDTSVDFGPGLDIAMSYACDSTTPTGKACPGIDVIPKDQSGSSTIAKKKRKRRAAICLDQDNGPVVLKMSDEIEDCYIKYVRCQYIRPVPNVASPDFVAISGFHSSYERFRDSLRPRGHVFDDVMGLYVQLFNMDHKICPDSRLEPKKIAFSPFLTGKLSYSPKDYIPESNEAEVTRINAEMNIVKADLLLFPLCLNDHWILIGINMLAGEVHFLDSGKTISESVRTRMIDNVLYNFQRTCAVSHVFDRNLTRFTKIYPTVPYQSTTYYLTKFDCGIYVMLFMQYWNGRLVRNFDSKVATLFRRIVAYRLITCPENEIDPNSF
ncbi:hypothetical protein ACP70R_009838 [Stipagrostis hirtigluma subsp. patula]